MRPGRQEGAALALACLSLVACRSTRAGREESVDAPTPADPAPPSSGEAGQESTSGNADTTTNAAAAEKVEAPRRWITGSLDSRVVARSTHGDHDWDVYEVLSLYFGREDRDRWTGQFTGRLAWDADGTSPSFPSLADTEGNSLDGQIYTAYAKRRDWGPIEELTIGRQFLYDTPVVAWLDGIALESKPRGTKGWTTGLYGGVPVHSYEPDWSGDAILGLYEEVFPSKTWRLRGDWMHVRDERTGFSQGEDLFAVSAQHDPTDKLQLDAKYSRLESDDRDLSLGASWSDYEKGFTLQATWYRLLERQDQHVLEFDPFFDQLLTLFPYDQVRVLATKDLGETVHLQGGVDLRRVVDQGDVGAFNHDFERYFVTATFDELLPKLIVLALTGEVWDGDDTDYQTWGFDLSREWNERWDASLGSFYSLFKFDPFSGSEREDVRTYYLALKRDWSEALSFGLRYELENEDAGDFHRVRLGASWRF